RRIAKVCFAVACKIIACNIKRWAKALFTSKRTLQGCTSILCVYFKLTLSALMGEPWFKKQIFFLGSNLNLLRKGTYFSGILICGERRLVAAQQLGLESVPVRVIEAGKELGETIALQLTENLQREDLNPIDQAKGILSYIQAKHPDKGYDVDGVMSDLIKYNRKPDTLSEAVVSTVDTTMQISGKAYTSLFRTISLLKLSSEIQAEIRSGNLPVSHGYLFAANLDCPDRMKIFTDIIKTPVTYITLERMLTAYKQAKPDPNNTKPVSVKKHVKGLISIKTGFEKGLGTYIREDVEAFLYELQVFCDFVQQQAPMIPYGKKRPPQV
ncbi:MAG: ParB N-terminal domain-containing protein, partial [Proteobacteria bacterium]|nr:ParB N-terminal domain-containing protein [Pseudomonadota bacterium]